ncbi:DNA primase [Campylobacter cuniculorum]|uniref:DNA primase n=3 Tax=Campylobacter cuniculorum TaxID=374106 RepID=A0A1W6BXY9_9BACT|nr:DNA primase [Campylobacter cuniculorum]ARJ56989.1 DNA primase [Campylobacter cuniculorum DSM 23162 = LMG 24588]QOR04442.1 DNA primase [Campylobacter cuniculorum]
MITKESIENLSQRVDIVDIISQYIEVRKQGSSYVCICPFHNDKNPSMHINSQKGFYHCFACKAGGDVFKFIMDYEKLDFSDAVEKVARLCNFTLSYTQEKKEKNSNLKYILPRLNAFYKQNLSQHRTALEYLYQRGLNDEDIKKFELGFAPQSHQTLRLLQNEKIPFDEALKVGAIKEDKENNEFYASFINRITFPIYDHKAFLVGFGGRTLDANHMAKYVNSPQSALFDKGRIFYAFHLAKESISKKKEMIVCEGYMDAIAFHKAGSNNAVAVLGTALGENHLPLIKRYEAKVILCFDNDEAGLNAAMRSAFLLSIHKIDGKVVLLEGGKDPAELVLNHQEKILFERLERGIELGEFYIRMLLKEPLNSALQKQKALENVQKYTHLLEPLIANSYVGLVSRLLGVNENLIKLTKNTSSQKNSFDSHSNLTASRTKIHIAEFGLLDFLKKSLKARELFMQISDTACFEHRELLSKILQGLGNEDSDIREFELYDIKSLKNQNEFLLGIIKVNLAFLNRVKIQNPSLALKKQLFTLFDKNSFKFLKILKTEESTEFLKQILITLKQEKDEEKLELIFKYFYKIFQKSSLDKADLKWDKNETEQENPF